MRKYVNEWSKNNKFSDSKVVAAAKTAAIKMKNRVMMSDFMNDNRGMGVVEVILIILVLVGLVVLFRTNITTIVNNIFKKITTKVNTF